MRNESGQILTELAIFSPIFMLVIVAIVGLAQAGQKQAVVARAAAASARVAAVAPEMAPAEALAVLAAADPAIDEADVVTTVEPLEAGRLPFSRPARVTVTYRYKPISGFGWRPTFTLRESFVTDQYNNAIIFEAPP